MDSFKTTQHLFTVSQLALGAQFTKNFEALSDGIKGFFGNIVGLRLFFDADIAESSAAADLEHETLRNFMSSLTIKNPTAEWCSAITGRDLLNLLFHSGILCENATDLIETVDFSSSTSSADMEQEYLIPFALGHYLPRNFSEEDDLMGSVPVSMMKKSGSMSASLISSLGGNWGLYGATTVTVYCYADIVWTRKPVTYVPSFFKAQDWNSDQFELDTGGRAVSIPYLAVFDDDFLTFTLPTEPRVEMDGNTVQSLVTGSEINKRVSWNKDDIRSLYADPSVCLMVPSDANDPGGWPTGRIIKVVKAGAQHTGDSRYVYMGYQETKPTDLLNQLEAQGFNSMNPSVQEAVKDLSTLRPSEAGRPSRILKNNLPAGTQIDPRNVGARVRAFTVNV